jgi:hypothetical protein
VGAEASHALLRLLWYLGGRRAKNRGSKREQRLRCSEGVERALKFEPGPAAVLRVRARQVMGVKAKQLSHWSQRGERPVRYEPWIVPTPSLALSRPTRR